SKAREPRDERLYGGEEKGDILHTNSVQVLSSDLKDKFPLFKPGQVLISVRNLNAIALLDMEEEKIVWAARGTWRAQHDAQFLDNGRILIFDNNGSDKTSRVLEYDPQTQKYPWTCESDPPRICHERGMCQRLPNGNTLLVDSERG